MSTIEHPPGTGSEQTPRGPGANPAAGRALGGFETRLLAELQTLLAERPPTAGAGTSPAGRRAGEGTLRRLALTGGLAAAVSAGLAVTLTLASTGARPPAHNFAAPVTAAAVLNDAALAALRQPAHKPRPDQFVYFKTYTAFDDTRSIGHPVGRGTDTRENWASVSGTRRGLDLESIKYGTGPTKRFPGVGDWCAHGVLHPQLMVKHKPVREHCTARRFADYLPQLPTTTAGMRAYLLRQLRMPDSNFIDGHSTVDLLSGSFYILTWYYLTPAQQAAMYHALATIPGLTVVPKMTDVEGRMGVGVRYHSAAQHVTWAAIFDSTTFKPLGANIDWPRYHARAAVITPPTLVGKAGQRP